MWSCLSTWVPIFLVWHIILFNLLLSAKDDINFEMKKNNTHVCVLDGNALTNTIICGKDSYFNRVSTYIESTMEPCIIDPYSCIIPLKFVYTNTICP